MDSVGNMVPQVEDSSSTPLEQGASFEFVQQFEAIAQKHPSQHAQAFNWAGADQNPDEWINYRLFFDVDPVAILSNLPSIRDRLRLQIGQPKPVFQCSNPTVTHEHEHWTEYCMDQIPDPDGPRLCSYPIPH